MAMSLADRALGAIIGSAVADAAAQPLHWVYDLDKLDGFLNEAPTPEFRPKSANPFYRRDTGNQSCYGDQAFVLLESLSECGGLNVNDLRKRTYNFFGPRSEYDTPVNDPYRDRSGPRPQLPIEGPWRHGSIKSFMKNMDAGQEDTGCETDFQPDGIAKLAPIVALYAGKPDMLEKVEEAVRVTQNNDACVAETLAAARILEHFILNGPSFCSRILEHFILNGPDEKVLDSVLDQLTDPNRKQPQDLDKAVVGHIYQVRENLSKAHQDLIPSVFPNSCGLPGSFQAALHGVLTAKEFDQAIRDTMVCGGCTCSRSSFIGACLGAQIGLQGIPNSWKTKTLRYNSLLELGKKVTERYHQM
ncbi:crystallin J1A-like isoform X2 [Oncorhynchus keta]|uniref:crystallin J1A-like isoform X2 n=1 Tax=Oncorhynchus keta TaxID=8018 RepID=UPI0015F8DC18|nr:crystallin J1A-like isoform X2 [Oncorhynchus keta]